MVPTVCALFCNDDVTSPSSIQLTLMVMLSLRNVLMSAGWS